MTFQPPPPPPSGEDPPTPPAQWAPPPGTGRPAAQPFDPKTVDNLDWAILGLGGLILIFSFFSYYTLDAGPLSASAGAWNFSHGAFVAWFAMAFAVAGAAVLAQDLVAPEVKLAWPARQLSATLLAIGSVLYILAIFIHPRFFDFGAISYGHGFSFWLSLVMTLAATGVAVVRLQQTGETLPGPLANLPTIGRRGPQGGVGGAGGTGYPPPPGQAPPPEQTPPPSYGPPPGT